MLDKLINNHGGLYGRVTYEIKLSAFTLRECEEFYRSRNVQFSRYDIAQSYMIFGGIPYYLNLYDRRLSLAQNVDSQIFDERGDLHYEYDHLFKSLYKRPDNHIKIIETIAARRRGLRRTDLTEESGIADGEGLTKALSELEQFGFIREYKNIATS